MTLRAGPALLLGTALLLSPTSVALVASGSSTLEACGRQIRDHPENEDGYACAWRVSRIRRQAPQAARLLESVLALAPGNDWARLYLGAVEAEQNHDRGEVLYRQALTGFEAKGDLLGQIRTLEALAFFCKVRGRLEEEDGFLSRARTLARRHPDPAERIEADMRWGWRCIDRGVFDEAAETFRGLRSDPEFPSAPMRLRLQVIDGNAAAAWVLGDYERAMQAFRSEYRQARDAGLLWYAADVAMQNARVATDRWRVTGKGADFARRQIAETLELARAADNVVAEGFGELALSALIDGNPARQALARASEAFARSGYRAAQLRSAAALAWWDGVHDPERAEQSMARLEEIAGDEAFESEPYSRLEALDFAADLARDRLSPERAIAASERSLATIESLRGAIASPQIRARAFQSLVGMIETYIDYRLRLWQASRAPEMLDAAFAVEERYRAQMLRETRPRRAEGETSPEAESARAAGLTDVQTELQPGEALVAFTPVPPSQTLHEGGPSLWATWITAQGAGALPLLEDCDRGCLMRRVELFEKLIRRRDGSEARSAESLYEMILAPVLGQLPPETRRLIVLPAGALRRLPLHLLRPGDGRGPVGSWLELSTAPSATVWLDARHAPRLDRSGLLSVSDPRREDARRLNASRSEAAALRRALGMRAKELRGSEATEAALRAVDPSRFNVVHIAAHARVDRVDPSRTVLLLAPGSGDQEDDGELDLEEFASLPLAGRTVLLTSCESVGGAPINGEDLVGLGHAAFRAGARTVLGSLWPVRDDEAALFMADLARGMGEGEPLAATLRAVRRRWAESGRPAETWAAIVLIGDDRVAPARGGHPVRASRLQYAVAAAVFALLLLASLLLVSRAGDPLTA